MASDHRSQENDKGLAPLSNGFAITDLMLLFFMQKLVAF
jgi:hypothetical protein